MATTPSSSLPERQSLEETLSETLADDELSPAGVAHRLEVATGQLDTTQAATNEPLARDAADTGTPSPDRPGLSNPAPLPLSEETSFDRYVLEKVLGRGARGAVYAARDHAFQREVAIKFLHSRDALTPEGLARFIQEGRLAAKLEHPGIAPMYDMDFTKEGEAYLVMRQVHGRSLDRLIRDDAILPPSQRDVNERVNILIRVCEAIAFSHSKEIVHRDIKPANIMVGHYGEVIVVDWGTACSEESSSSGQARLVGTPLYMSPEQARREPAGARSDIYSLGATLFRLVVGRHAVWARDPESFWERKQKGELDPLTQSEQANVTRPLVAIVLKAMAPDPKERYESAEALLHDLRAYQDGLAVSAHRDSLLEMLVRWYRRWTHVFWVSTAASLLLLAAGWHVYGERLKEIASWGNPATVETFEDEDWQKDWLLLNGETRLDKGRLVTVSPIDMYLLYRHRISGGVAIEFDGEIAPGSPPGDLSVFWLESAEAPETKEDANRASRFCYLQTGGRGNTHARIAQLRSGRMPMALTPFQLVEGRVYRIRAEIDGYVHRLFADGQMLCEYRSLFPMQPGYIGIYGYFAGKIFDNITVYTKDLPEKTSVITLGDRLFSKKEHRLAIEEYQMVESSHTGKSVANEARYKRGLCHYNLKEKKEAFRIWGAIRDGPFAGWVELHRLEEAALLVNPQQLLGGMRSLYRRADKTLRQAICRLWGSVVRSRRFFPEHSRAFLQLHREVFPDNAAVREIAAFELVDLGQEEEALRDYPQVTEACGKALLRIGRWEELLAKYPHNRYHAARALLLLGRDKELLQQYSDIYEYSSSVLIRSGQAEEALRKYPDNPTVQYNALWDLGRHDEIRKRFSSIPRFMARFHNSIGEFENVIKLYPDQASQFQWAMLHLGRHRALMEMRSPDRSFKIRALIGLGYLDKATRLYPDIFSEAICARLLQGDFEEVIRAPIEAASVLRALIASGRSDLAAKRFAKSSTRLLLEGRYKDVLDLYPDSKDLCARALVHLGHTDDALRLHPHSYRIRNMARWRSDLEAVIADDKTDVSARFAGHLTFHQITPIWWNHFPRFVLKPFLKHVVQGKGGLHEAYDRTDKDHPELFSQRLHHAMAFLLGRVDEKAFLAQPVKLYAASDLLLYQGMRSEILKNNKALGFYKAFHALPAWQKCCNPVIERFVEWRIQQLNLPATDSR